MKAIRRIAAFVVAIVFVFGCMFVPDTGMTEEAHAATAIHGDYVEGEVVVCYVDTDDMDLSAREERKAENLLEDADEIMTFKDVSLEDVSVDESMLTAKVQKKEEIDKTLATVTSDTKSTEELMEELSQLPNVDYVEPNYIFRICDEEEAAESEVQQEPEIQQEAPAGEVQTKTDFTPGQWGYNTKYGLNIPDWNNPENVNAAGTVVAILDSGVDYYHEDLDDVMWGDGKSYSALTRLGGGKYGIDTCNRDSNPMDDNGHGTHCAGIVAAEWNGIGVSGAANGTEIMAVKAGDKDGYLDYDDILTGYRYILTAARQGVNLVAVNNSWGSGADETYGLDELINQAGELGIVSVFASGNEESDCDQKHLFVRGRYAFDGYFICYFFKDNPYEITVDATGYNSSTDSCRLADFSNYGKQSTDLAAPGARIWSTMPDDDYKSRDGTSMAAPAVTGEVAIVSSAFPDASADVIASIITSNTRSESCVANYCKSGGLANAGKALSADPTDIKYSYMKLDKTTFYYDGSFKWPEITTNLEEGTDYQAEYPEDRARMVGSYEVDVYGIGDYHGYVELPFKIVVKPTGIAKLTRAKRAFTVKAQQQGSKYVSGYQVRYSRNSSMSGATIKTIGTSYSKVSKKFEKLKKKTKYYVQVRTYKTINGTKYYSSWSSKKTVKTK